MLRLSGLKLRLTWLTSGRARAMIFELVHVDDSKLVFGIAVVTLRVGQVS
jgi:hypothetical protein